MKQIGTNAINATIKVKKEEKLCKVDVHLFERSHM